MTVFFKRFRFQVTLRIIFICCSIYAFFYFYQETHLRATAIFILLIVIFQVFALVRFVEKNNRELQRFFLAIQQEDFSRTFSGKELGSSFAELIDAFNSVIEKIQQTRSEREEHYRYLQTIVHHVGIGLITFRPDGHVDMINTAAKRLFQVAHLKNIKALQEFSKPLVKKLFTLKPGEKALVKIDNREMDLVVRAAEFRMQEQTFTLVSFQDIQGELEEKEMEAWQTLIRVLTHEIMNSMTPITSMAATVIDLLDSLAPVEQYENSERGPGYGESSEVNGNKNMNKETYRETVTDITAALQTIYKRSQGLSDFVNAYRNLTLIPKPNFELFPVEELFCRVEQLLGKKLKENGVSFGWQVDPESLELTADPALIEQVVINLVLNAVDAFQGFDSSTGITPVIFMDSGLSEEGRVFIRVKDNGPGIEKEALDKIFIPFYTTKKKGSGIGLSLSRQILKQHRGSISVHSLPGEETIFTLKF